MHVVDPPGRLVAVAPAVAVVPTAPARSGRRPGGPGHDVPVSADSTAAPDGPGGTPADASPSDVERAALVAALLAAGPDAPTLCSGWTTRDLAAHLVMRERRPDAALGMVVPALAGHAESVRAAVLRRPFTALVAVFAAGPPRLSPFAVKAFDAAVNTGEHFVHTEDVRRAGPGGAPATDVEPRVLAEQVADALWRTLAGRARLIHRRCPVGVELVTDRGSAVVRRAPEGTGTVRVRGDVGEVILHSFGREGVARVELEGAPDDVAAYRGLSRRV